MARYKVKGKDCQLKVKVKLSFKEEIDERQLDFFSNIFTRGLFEGTGKEEKLYRILWTYWNQFV